MDLDKIKKQTDLTESPPPLDHVDFKADIIELRSFGFDVLVVLENLEIFYIYVSSEKLVKHYAGKINSLSDTPVQRIKYTSLCISNKNDFGLLSIFLNSLVILYITKTSEEEKDEEEKIMTNKIEDNFLTIESTYEYYDFRVNSSLILIDQGKEGEYIWHVDDEHRLIKSRIRRSSKGYIEIISNNDQIILTEKSIIDINQFNNEQLILLQRNIKSNKILLNEINLISAYSLYGGAFEDIINFIGISSDGKCFKFDISNEKQTFKLLKSLKLSDDHSLTTTCALSPINKYKYICYIGTSYGSPVLSTFSKSEDEQVKIYRFNDTYGCISSMCMFNNSLKFSYGIDSTKVQSIESSSHKILAKCGLECIFNALASLSSKSNPSEDNKSVNTLETLFSKNPMVSNMKVFIPSSDSKDSGKESSNKAHEKSIVFIFLSLSNYTLVLKFDFKGYHIEVVQFLEVNFKDLFQTKFGYIFVFESDAIFISHNDLLNGNIDKLLDNTRKEEKVKIISQCYDSKLVIYKCDNTLSIYSNIDSIENSIDIKDPTFVYSVLEDENITHLCLNSNILIASCRLTNKYHFSTYELKVYFVEEKSLRFLYTIPICAEDINDQAINPFYITDLIFEDDCLQYTYNYTITVQRKAVLETFRKCVDLSDINCVDLTNDDIFEMHKIINVNDNSSQIGSKNVSKGTYSVLDQNNKLNIISNINSELQLVLNSNQEILLYSNNQASDLELDSKRISSIRCFIENSKKYLQGVLMITTSNKIVYHNETSNKEEISIFECAKDEEIICTSKLCKTKYIFGDNSIFDQKYEYILGVSTKSSHPSKFDVSNFYTIGINLNEDEESKDQLCTSQIVRSIGYPIITAIYFLSFHSKAAKKYCKGSNPHFILGLSNTLATGKYIQELEEAEPSKTKVEETKNTSALKDSEMLEEDKKFDIKNPDSIKVELISDKTHTFTWISNILCYSFENQYLVVHDLMKGICILNNGNGDFGFIHENVCLIDTSTILIAHCITKTLFLAQDDNGMLYLVSAKKKKQKRVKVWVLQQNAQYFMNERISSFLSLEKGVSKSLEVFCSTVEGNIYNIKIIDNEMIKFMAKIQYNIMRIDSTSQEEKEEVLKIYEKGFGNGFNGNLISNFFNFDQKEIKQLLLDIRDENRKDNESKSINFNLLSIKMLFF